MQIASSRQSRDLVINDSEEDKTTIEERSENVNRKGQAGRQGNNNNNKNKRNKKKKKGQKKSVRILYFKV